MNWKRGKTLLTSITANWSKEAFIESDKIEQKMILSDFTTHDNGRSRQKVCDLNEYHPDYESNAKLIAAAPYLLEACKEFIRKCECGEARSRKSYRQMKEAVNKVTDSTK